MNVPIISDYDVTAVDVAGRAVAGFDLRIVDDQDREVPVGHVGELVVRSAEPWIMATEYHRNPEASLRLFRNCFWMHVRFTPAGPQVRSRLGAMDREQRRCNI